MGIEMRKTVKWLTLAFGVLLLSACAARLAPSYDKTLVDGITTVNTNVMELFASVSSGTKAATYSKRQATYDKLIGQLDALAIQANARPEPKSKITQAVNEALRKRGIPVVDSSGTPSAAALDAISGTLAKMKQTDKKQGLTAFEVKAFKGQVAIYMDQALTYENFLNR